MESTMLFIDNFIKRYAKDMVQYQRYYRIITHDLNLNLIKLENDMQNVRSVDISAIKGNFNVSREHILIDQIQKKEEIEMKINSFNKLIKNFDSCVKKIELDNAEKKILENSIETIYKPLELSNLLQIPIEQLREKEASVLLKLGYKLLGMENNKDVG